MSTPGWYPQPDGNDRYYDGNGWTDHVRAPQVAGAMAPQMPPKKKGGAMKWIALGVGVLLVLCCGGVALSMGGDDDNTSAETTSTSESAESSAAETTDEPSAKKSSSKSSSSTKASEPAAPASADVTVTAGAIIEEFESNELAGDKKYKGKTVEVSGVVEEIDTELFADDKYLLRITDGGDYEFLSVTCHDMDNDVLSALTVGDSITVIGDFDDGGDLGVDLKKCKVV